MFCRCKCKENNLSTKYFGEEFINESLKQECETLNNYELRME